ncbi:MAG: TetR/AcrR family transcriptional regulator [Vitreoscilla sp.]
MTTPKPTVPRPGGRSARVQAAVHQATIELMAQHGRAGLTVPLIAARAGVTPSTIYRRWGELADLLADVAVERMRPDGDPTDTGSVAGDLQAWVEQYRDEMSSDVGLGLMLDVLSAKRGELPKGQLPVPCQCAAFTALQIEAIVARGIERGEPVPEVDAVMDTVISPIIFRALFGTSPMTPEQAQALVAACLKTARKAKAAA